MQSPPVLRRAAGFSPQRCPGRREAEAGGRSQSITNFFKPTQSSSDRIVLGSQQNGNLNNDSVRLAVPGAERLGNFIKISSPARSKRKMPSLSTNRSPIIEAFLRGVKPEKTTILPNAFESSCTKCHETITSPKVVVRQLFLSKDSPVHVVQLHDKAIRKKLPRNEGSVETSRLFSVDNSTERKATCMLLGGGDSVSSRWSKTPESDVLKDSGRGLENVSNMLPWHQSSQSSTRKSHDLLDCSFQTSVRTNHSNPERGELNAPRMEPAEQPSSPVMASSSRASNISFLENGSRINNGPCSVQSESGPVESSRFSQKCVYEISSPERTYEPFIIKKSNSFPLTRSRAKIALCHSSRQGLVPRGKRKRSSWHSGLQQTNSEAQNSDSYQSRSGKKINPHALFVESMLTASSIGVPHLEKAVVPSTDENAVSQVSLECNSENTKEISLKNSSPLLHFGEVCSGYFHPNNVAHSVELTPPGVLSLKKSKLSLTSHERPVDNHSTHLQSKMCTNSQYPQEILLPLPSVAKSSELLPTMDFNLAECEVEESRSSECHSKLNCKESDFLPYVDVLAKQSLSMDVDQNVHSASDSAFSSRSLQSSNGMFNSNRFENSKPNGKLEDTLDSDDDSFVCNFDSDAEDEMLKPLEEILQIASKPPSATPEKASSEVSSSQGTITPSNTPYTIRSPVFYTNNLDRMLKEKEDSKRLDELEKKLKCDIEQGMGIFSPFGEECNTDEEGNLTEEHRAFITKFAVVTDAIPDLHPGEEIFRLSDSGKLFNQNTLYLNNSECIAQSEEEKLILSSGRKQQLILITQGFLSLIYRFVQCPVPILKWLFQMMSVHSDYIVSVQILNTLVDITVSNFSTSDTQFRPWIPSVLDVAIVFVNMGVPFTSLFPLEHLQPDFKESDILVEMRSTVSKEEKEAVPTMEAFSRVPEANIFNVVKFLGLCTAICPEGYKDQEMMQLLILLFKIRLEKQLKQIPLVDFQCLLENLLKNIRDWDAKMPEICSCISELSSHHHNLLKLVQLVPNSIARGREVRRRLSLVIISKLLDKKPRCLPEDSSAQMSVLCQYLIQMKPSALTKRLLAELTAEQQNDSPAQCLPAKLEQQAYYLTYSLLHLVNEASYSDACPSNQRTFIQQLSSALEKHVKCDIREDARLFYKTKVKDLVARIYGKWQELLINSRPIKGKLHDYWEPVFESQSPTSRSLGIGEEPFPIQ